MLFVRVFSLFTLLSLTACAVQSDHFSDNGKSNITPEIRTLIAEVQRDYMLCMLPKLSEYDILNSDVPTVAAALRASCSSAAEEAAIRLQAVDASPAFRAMLAQEWIGSLEGHSTRLVERWRDHLQSREPPYYKDPVRRGRALQ